MSYYIYILFGFKLIITQTEFFQLLRIILIFMNSNLDKKLVQLSNKIFLAKSKSYWELEHFIILKLFLADCCKKKMCLNLSKVLFPHTHTTNKFIQQQCYFHPQPAVVDHSIQFSCHSCGSLI